MKNNVAIVVSAVALTVTALAPTASAQRQELVGSLVRTRGYVVGAALSQSGLHVHRGDTSWAHVGWNHPMIFGVAVDPRDPAVMFLAAGNGALRTLDGGSSWRITTDWRVTEVMDVDIDPQQTDRVFIATAYGVWRSDDRGESWQQTDRGIAEKYTSAIRVDRAGSGAVLAGTVAGIYRSGDAGASWTRVSDPEYITDIQQSRSDPQQWIASSHEGGVFLSKDGGASWYPATGRVESASLYAAAIDPTNASRMAAAGFDDGLFLSRDAGASWTPANAGLPGCEAFTVIADAPVNPGPCLYEVVFDPNRSGRLVVATVESGVFISDNFGGNWRYAGMDGAVVYDLVFARRPR